MKRRFLQAITRTGISKFTTLEGSEKRLFVLAWLMLGWTRAALLLLSFRRLAVHLEHSRDGTNAIPPTSGQLEQAARIGWLVAAAARATPWQSRCLVQVLVVQRLLARRGIPGQFHLGVRRRGVDTGLPPGLSAHAWLECGTRVVNGGSELEQFTVISTFRWDGAAAARGSD